MNPLRRSSASVARVKGSLEDSGPSLSLRMKLWRLFGITNGHRERHHSAVLKKEEHNKGRRRKERSRGGGERMWALNGGELNLKREGLERWRLNFHSISLTLSLYLSLTSGMQCVMFDMQSRSIMTVFKRAFLLKTHTCIQRHKHTHTHAHRYTQIHTDTCATKPK